MFRPRGGEPWRLPPTSPQNLYTDHSSSASVSEVMPGLTNPPSFPDDIPTHPLLVIDYQLIREGDENELNRLWKAATELGFW